MFHIMVLFVDEAESVARQLKRGRQVVAHNEEVIRSGVGELWEELAMVPCAEAARPVNKPERTRWQKSVLSPSVT